MHDSLEHTLTCTLSCLLVNGIPFTIRIRNVKIRKFARLSHYDMLLSRGLVSGAFDTHKMAFTFKVQEGLQVL